MGNDPLRMAIGAVVFIVIVLVIIYIARLAFAGGA